MGILEKRLYYEDQYKRECRSRVQEIIERDGKVLVVLDNSPFYPAGGGQPCDSGWIGDERVIDVFEMDGTVYNQVSAAPSGEEVECSIDFSRRFDLMQQHTGEHLLSAAFLKKYGGINKGFHIGDEHCTIDIDLPEVTEEMARSVELEANGYVFKNITINSYLTDRETAESLPLRTKIKVKDDSIRIVEIGNTDMCACCGLHLKTTGETGIIKINKLEKYKGMTRVYFRCGFRALSDYDSKQKIIGSLVRITASEETSLPERYLSQNEKIAELGKKLSSYRKRAAAEAACGLLDSSGSELIYVEYEDRDFEEMLMIADEVSREKRIFLGLSLLDRKILLSHNGYSDIACGKLFKDNIKDFSGRGGGDSKRAQGTFSSEDDMMNFAELLKTRMGFNDRT
ncbi:MAG: serine-tRNA(Ala) deacylase AlaX [Firmicutes bacterium]|nr:serine-tRNA(Ala) deacylase AlaX [Bacillota bacterium]